MLLKSVILLTTFYFTKGARILGIAPVPSYSHHEVYKALWQELSLRGHQVTTMTPFPIKNPELINLTEIDLSSSRSIWAANLPEIMKTRQSIKSYHVITNAMLEVVDHQLNHSAVQALINDQTVHFDLVIAEQYMSTMFAFARRFDCPLIGIFSMDVPNFKHRFIGNPNHPVAYPDLFLPYYDHLTLGERVFSTVYTLLTDLYSNLYFDKWEQGLITKYFGNYPSVEELAKNASLVFINSNPVLNNIRPLVPAVIQIGGGSHHRPLKPLPKDLEITLNNAKDGFIYFSLGTNVMSTDLTLKIRNEILDSFAELPYTVLWKYDSDDLVNKPKNVLVSKWWPQQDLLRHTKIKLFITQGGLQSIDEAIFANVPILGIPFIADQPGNVQKVHDKGLGLFINPENINKENFKRAILDVIKNPKYKNNIIKLANLARDQPMSGIERAVWWTEYVLRHKGAVHLRSPFKDLPWYQYFLLDVITVLVLSFTVPLYILYILKRSISKLFYYISTFKTKSKIH